MIGSMLESPLVVFDLETTGSDVGYDRIVQFAGIRVPSAESFRRFGDQTRELTLYVNPEMPISPEALAVHGITEETVAHAPTFGEVAETVREFLREADLCGYNMLAFDLPVLMHEFKRVDPARPWEPKKSTRLFDPWVILRKRESRTLAWAHQFYCGRPLENAHDAMADAKAALDVLVGQLGRYGETVEGLAGVTIGDRASLDGKIAWDEAGVARFTFGRCSGVSLEDAARTTPQYLRWILRQKGFSDDVRGLVMEALAGKPVRKTRED